MKKIIISGVIIIILAAVGIFCYTRHATAVMNQKAEESKAEELMNQRINDILAERDDLKKERDGLKQEQDGLKEEISALTEQVKELLTKEEVRLDAETIENEIKQIGELASVSYHYTNVGTIDVDTKLFNTSIKLPGGSKTAVVTMDGVIKAGIEVSELSLKVDEENKVITVKVPATKILSHETFEDSVEVYNESSGVFNKITIDDTTQVRKEIKEKAEEKALSTEVNILKQAAQNVEFVIRNFLTTDPLIRENYKINFE